ncbi:hypothetical protein HJG54_32390 [Leptolyngbya sp. NK1-12]|uniref:Uncharacterized protein n=1 Tax=Leptolyngbya sp. NK1-12 TaxID=2547451 RepID=A0AA97AK97_9CYAN|nr:hypothetical protein [Leptolyngbya sp. NK1-12]WNZ27569.1 hypothetical protein HJG54_32390 [Leptolyngbya sp. NK1-12]
MPQPVDYEEILFNHYTEAEVAEIQTLMTNWDQATYPTLAASIVKHAQKHGFTGDYLRYLRKAASFNKKGARRKQLPDGATRWHKGQEFLIERNGKIVTYGENS